MALDGALPTNTNGGLTGEAYIHGMNSMIEGVRQIRGTSYNQVTKKTVEHVLVSSGMAGAVLAKRSEEHTSELQSLMRISYAVFCLKKKIPKLTTRKEPLKQHKSTTHN